MRSRLPALVLLPLMLFLPPAVAGEPKVLEPDADGVQRGAVTMDSYSSRPTISCCGPGSPWS